MTEEQGLIVEPSAPADEAEYVHPLRDSKRLMAEAQRFFHFINTVILPFEPPKFKTHSKFHRHLMYTACEPMSVTAAPRGFIKSTIFSRYRPLHRLVDPIFYPEETIETVEQMLVSETAPLARSHLAWIKHHLTKNPLLIAKYGKLKPDRAGSDDFAWNNDEIKLTNGAVCMALGYGSQIRSRHPSDITVDDLESKKNMDTPEKLADLTDWFYKVLMGAMVPETRLTVIGTIIEQQSLLLELLGSDVFHGKLWKALSINKEGQYQSLWPDRFPVKYLLYRRKILGTHRFNAEYQNEPRGLTQPIIEERWVKRFSEEWLRHQTHLKIKKRYITVDPAVTEERWGCPSGITVFDHFSDDKLRERLAYKFRATGPELIRTIMNVWYSYSKGQPTELAIEEAAMQKMFRQSIQELDSNISITPFKPEGDKVTRLVDVSRYVENGMVEFKTESYIDELLNFPKGDKDRVDAGVMAWKLFERDNPYILDGQTNEIDVRRVERLDDVSLEAAISRVMRGLTSGHVPQALLEQYQDAMDIQQQLSDLM